MSIQIRRENRKDLSHIHRLTASAFRDVAHASHTEPFIIDALRQAGKLAISLVAEEHGKIIGHVAVSPITISDGSSGWYGLGPISVLPERQKQGIGSALMKQALAELKQIQAAGCVLLGDPNYYSRFGFKAVSSLVLPGVPPEYFQALLFGNILPSGVVSFHPSFDVKQ